MLCMCLLNVQGSCTNIYFVEMDKKCFVCERLEYNRPTGKDGGHDWFVLHAVVPTTCGLEYVIKRQHSKKEKKLTLATHLNNSDIVDYKKAR